ncbi:MAG: branched-chain amino acid ABC transporter permease [Dehalococcoidia bacterium]
MLRHWQNSIHSLVKRSWPAVSLILILLVISLISTTFGRLIGHATIELLVMVVVVVGMYIFIGNSGIVSFGHVVFMLLAAYFSAWLTLPVDFKEINLPSLPPLLAGHEYNVLLAAIISGCFASGFAGAVGPVLVRFSGVTPAMGMFLLLIIVHMVYSQWESLTLGLSSLVGLPRYVSVWVAFGWAAVAIVVAYVYQSSRFGLALRATREDEVAAQASGIHILRQRMIALVLSAFFVGIGGALYGHFLGVISVRTFYLVMTIITLEMLVVGGMRSLSGSVIGVIAVSAFVQLFRELEFGIDLGGIVLELPTYSQELGLAVLLVLILFFRPGGIMGDRELRWPFGIGMKRRLRIQIRKET